MIFFNTYILKKIKLFSDCFGVNYAQVNCIVFDKTGTLTIGKPLVVNTRLLKNMVLREFYELIAAAEVPFLYNVDNIFSFFGKLYIFVNCCR